MQTDKLLTVKAPDPYQTVAQGVRVSRRLPLQTVPVGTASRLLIARSRGLPTQPAVPAPAAKIQPEYKGDVNAAGQPHGLGVETSWRETYEGAFQNGLRHGKGTLRIGGLTHRGTFRHGLHHGPFIVTSPGQQPWSVTFVAGRACGPMKPAPAVRSFDPDEIQFMEPAAVGPPPAYEEEGEGEGTGIRPLPAGTSVAVYPVDIASDSESEAALPQPFKSGMSASNKTLLDGAVGRWRSLFNLCFG